MRETPGAQGDAKWELSSSIRGGQRCQILARSWPIKSRHDERLHIAAEIQADREEKMLQMISRHQKKMGREGVRGIHGKERIL